MKWKVIGILVLAIGLVFLPMVLSGSSSAVSYEECAGVEYIWLRGSGQEYGKGLERAAYAEKVAEKMESERIAAKYKFYEVNYPAIEIDITVGLEAFLTGGMGAEYGESVNAGIANLTAHIINQATICPQEKFVLAGYSQGAQVVGESLTGLYHLREKVAYVALLGDPKGYLPEGSRVWPASSKACGEGSTMSSYREWAPECNTFQGALLGRIPYVPYGWEGKVGLYCNEHDFICGSGETPLAMDGHSKYSEAMHIVAEKSAQKLVQYFPKKMSAEKTEEIKEWASVQLPMETVFLIDSSGSMEEKFEKVRGKVSELAELTLATGGRVALAEYRASSVDGYPRLLCNFSCGAAEFNSWLGGILSGDETIAYQKRGLYDGMMMAYEHLDWRKNTAKSIVVVTDTYGDGKAVDFERTVQKSYSLGGVSTYIASWHVTQDLQELISRTGGAHYVLEKTAEYSGLKFDQLINDLVGRPVVKLDKEVFYPASDEMVKFDARQSYGVGADIANYDWDIKGGGTKEWRRGAPEQTWTFAQGYEGYTVVWANDEDGRVGVTTAKVQAGVASEEDTGREMQEGDRKVSFVPDERKKNGINTDSWIEESRIILNHSSNTDKVRGIVVKKVEGIAEDIVGPDISAVLKNDGRKAQERADLDVVNAGSSEEESGFEWGWVLGGLMLLLSGAGLVGKMVVLRR